MQPVPYWRPTDIKRPRTQFSRQGNLAPGICAALHITMRHIYVFSFKAVFVSNMKEVKMESAMQHS